MFCEQCEQTASGQGCQRYTLVQDAVLVRTEGSSRLANSLASGD